MYRRGLILRISSDVTVRSYDQIFDKIEQTDIIIPTVHPIITHSHIFSNHTARI